MRSIRFVNRSTLYPTSLRAGLQTAWVLFGVAIALRVSGAWNYESTIQYWPPCLFHAVTDIECPGCGMTRAFLRLAQGDLAGAWSFHPFSPFLALLLLVLAWGPPSYWSWIQHSARAQRVAIVALSLLISWWAWAKVLPLTAEFWS